MFFSNIASYSDSDSDSEVEEQQEVFHKKEINPRWYEVSDEESDADVRVVLSREERSLNEIDLLLDELQLRTSIGHWKEAAKQYTTVVNEIEKHHAKYGTYGFEFLAFLKATTCDEALEAGAVEGMPKVEYSRLKQLVADIQIKREELKKEIEALDFEEDEENEEEEKKITRKEKEESSEEEQDEDYFSDMLSNFLNEKRKSVATYERLAKASKDLGFEGAHITALSCLIELYLTKTTLRGKLLVPVQKWSKALKNLTEIFNYVKTGAFAVSETFKGKIKGMRCVVYGALHGQLQKLSEALRNYSQQNSPSEIAYLEVPYLENQLLELADSLVDYYIAKSQMKNASLCCAVILDIIGYRRPAAHKLLCSKMVEKPKFITDDLLESIRKISATMHPFCSSTKKMVIVCYLSYQLALNGLYRQARDSLLRAGIASFIESESCERFLELGTVFNRAIAQIGLSAFIAGDIYEAYQLLGNLWSQDQTEVLLGQKVYFGDKNVDDVVLRDNMVPPHLFIPYQHLELAAMLSALVIDTTKEARNPYDRSQRDQQKFFYQAITRSIPLMGRACSTSERVAAAYRALKNGDFTVAKENVEGMVAWSSLPESPKALERYLSKLKETALHIFCLTNRCNFSTMSVSLLCLKYDLSESAVKDMINQIIADSDSLIAYWDKDEEYLYIDRSNITKLQHLVIGATNTASVLGPFTERRLRANEGRGRGRGGRGRLENRKNNF